MVPRSNRKLVFVIVVVLLAGIGCLLGSYAIPETYRLLREILRDVGIAFLVSVIVTISYEVYARTLYDLHTITGVLQAIVGDLAYPDIWTEIKGMTLEKEILRQNVQINMKINHLPGAPVGGAVLWMEFCYDLYSLRSTKLENVKIMHFVDFHLEDEKAKLPRFEYIKIGETEYQVPSDSSDNDNIKKGVFVTFLDIQPRGENPVKIITRRFEKSYLPGTYNLVMGEMTKGFTLNLLELPDNIEAHINLRPHAGPEKLEKGKTIVKDKVILLPGQCIEFRFRYKGHSLNSV